VTRLPEVADAGNTSAPSLVAPAITWSLILVGTTVGLVVLRDSLDRAHVAMVLLLVVLGAGARGGRLLGVLIGIASFIAFDVGFVPPYGRLTVSNPVDWLILVTFLATSFVAAELLHREQQATRLATEERERRGAESARAEAFRETEALKDALLSSVSHDLRTPLTSIKALANQLGSFGDERSQIIEEQADRLNRYVSDMLDLSRVNAGSMPVRLEVNAVDDLLSATIEETEAGLGRPLDVRLPPDGVLLAGRFDLSLSVRILVNLVENANKYAPQGSLIRLEAARRGSKLCIAVTDRGPGLEAAEVDRVFTPFYRPLSAPADRGSAGLGLALCQRMAELQKGRLTYAPNPAGGSVFLLELPAVELPSVAYEPPSL